MDAAQAAKCLAELVNLIEGSGISVEFSSGEVRVGEAVIRVGRYEGDPWTVEA